MIRLIQLEHPRLSRRVAVADDQRLQLLREHSSVYELAVAAIEAKSSLAAIVSANLSAERLDYNSIYHSDSEWKILPAFDHPDEPARCLVTGTGLTHKKSADSRQAMHVAALRQSAAIEKTDLRRSAEAPLQGVTDSMKMYQWGVDGGRPKPGEIGVQPEWFFKGCGTILRAHGQMLEVPPFANDGGEEAEVAGVYVVDASGAPRRVGLVQANEFSDHVMEEKNYLYLAHSKLRTCAIGPELIVDADFNDVRGTVRIERGGKVIWSQSIRTGEQNMSHTVANLEHHHFKYPAHRRPGDAHVYFFGADAFSFGDGVRLEDGDVMEIELAGFGRALRNPIRVEQAKPEFVVAKPL